MPRALAVVTSLIIFAGCAVPGYKNENWEFQYRRDSLSGNTTCEFARGPFHVTLVRLVDFNSTSASVSPLGGAGVYPGSTFYLSINGKSFSGEERIEIDRELERAIMDGTKKTA